MLGKLNFLYSFHILVSYFKLYSFIGHTFGMFAANLFVHNMGSFRGYKKLFSELLENEVLKLH